MTAKNRLRRSIWPALALVLLAAIFAGSWFYFGPAPRLVLETNLKDDGSAAFSPDGRLLAVWDKYSSRIVIWDVASGVTRADIDLYPGQIVEPDVNFTADGQHLLVFTQEYVRKRERIGAVRCWDIEASEARWTLMGHLGSFRMGPPPKMRLSSCSASGG